MGQKVSPVAFRNVIEKKWKWEFVETKNQQLPLIIKQNIAIEKALLKALQAANVSQIEIKRTMESAKIKIFCTRIGIVLGQENSNLPKLNKLVQKAVSNRKLKVNIDVMEVKNPDGDAQLISNGIAQLIEKRVSYRYAQKLFIKKALRNPQVKGIKTHVSGRLNNVEMARREGYSEGIIPLSSLKTTVDYGFAEAHTTVGVIGVKVWVTKDLNVVIKPRPPRTNYYRMKNNHHNTNNANFDQTKTNVANNTNQPNQQHVTNHTKNS